MVSKISVNGLDQDPNALKTPAHDGLLGKTPEESLYQVEPGSAGRSKMDVKAPMARQPGFYLGMFVGGVVIDNEM